MKKRSKNRWLKAMDVTWHEIEDALPGFAGAAVIFAALVLIVALVCRVMS